MQAQQGRWRLWASLGILAWAAALHAHMRYLQSTDEFKAKFPEIATDKGNDKDNETDTYTTIIRLRSSQHSGGDN